MAAAVLLYASAGFMVPVKLHPSTSRGSIPKLFEPGAAWNEWSLQQVGVLDGAVLATGLGSLYFISSRENSNRKAEREEPELSLDPNELPGLFSRRRDPPRMMVRSSEPRFQRLSREAFNRRNMSIDERRAFDEFMKKREANAKTRNTALAVVAVSVALLFASGTISFPLPQP
mmetsp:Transcript_16848/g.27949  ORF Transcript_16848/g.27949 Transcript_16848/m.27949 type:complete len:173 (-) Transcript_16848:462-980(-)